VDARLAQAELQRQVEQADATLEAPGPDALRPLDVRLVAPAAAGGGLLAVGAGLAATLCSRSECVQAIPPAERARTRRAGYNLPTARDRRAA